MTYREFRNEILPSVMELQHGCEEMEEEEFAKYSESVLKEVVKNGLSLEFMSAVLDMIHRNIFKAA